MNVAKLEKLMRRYLATILLRTKTVGEDALREIDNAKDFLHIEILKEMGCPNPSTKNGHCDKCISQECHTQKLAISVNEELRDVKVELFQ